MNLKKLFDAQRQIDEPWKDIPNRLEKDILWLQTELAELANEWGGHRYRYSAKEINRDRLLEEYVDCLSIILSLGILLGVEDEFAIGILNIPIKHHSSTRFFSLFRALFRIPLLDFDYQLLTFRFLSLGRALELDWEEVERKYFEKHEKNLVRQVPYSAEKNE